MAEIVINEISQNYTYNIGTNSYACVALPITASWGPGMVNPEEADNSEGWDTVAWSRFPATQEGLQKFVATYRGPSTEYRRAEDYSYQMAMTLLTAGYDVLTCRLCPGSKSGGSFKLYAAVEEPGGNVYIGDWAQIVLTAKYPGSFGNNLIATVSKSYYFDSHSNSQLKQKPYWSIIVYSVDSSGVRTALENNQVVFNPDDSSDSIPYWTELDSAFIDLSLVEITHEGHTGPDDLDTCILQDDDGNLLNMVTCTFEGGSDIDATGEVAKIISTTEALIRSRFGAARAVGERGVADLNKYLLQYHNVIGVNDSNSTPTVSTSTLLTYRYREWLYAMLVGSAITEGHMNICHPGDGTPYIGAYDLLTDKLSYNPNRIISPGWDDLYIYSVNEHEHNKLLCEQFVSSDPYSGVTPIHVKLLDVAYHSRCATAYIDIPKELARNCVYDERINKPGYAQQLARYVVNNFDTMADVNGALYATHSALFAPWGEYIYTGTGKMNVAPPSFLALMIQRAQILNQAAQYEWALPTNRKHNLKLGKMQYTVTKHILDEWQSLEGVGVNVITKIPDLGTNIWGNSTLFEVPPATYQALANLSTRWLVNAVEDVAYRVGVSITFQYNNKQAYDKFYAGCVPILDQMRNQGAIEDYYVTMAADIDGLDRVNANTVIGKIYLVVNGVVNDIYIDLIALPPGTDLNQFRS